MKLHGAERVAQYEAAGLWGVPTWPQLLEARAAEAGNRTAVVDPPNLAEVAGIEPARLTWSEVDARSRAMAAVLADAGIGVDDVVGLQLPNCSDLAVAYLAIVRLGAIASPFPMQYREYELGQMCELASVRAFIGVAEFGGRRLTARLDALAALPGVTTVLALTDLAARMADAPRAALPDLVADPNDAVTICWTSGTESVPKGVPRCANDWQPMGLTSVDAMGLGGEDVILNPFPMVNMAGIGGMFVPWLLTGAKLVLHHPFDPEVFFGQIAREQVTYTVMAPALLVQALELPALTPDVMASVRVIGSGSAPLPPSMIRAYRDRFGIDVVNCFGSNEGVNLVGDAATIPDPELRSRLFPRFGSPDHAWDNRGSHGYRTRLVDPATGAIISEPGVPGELHVQGPGVIAGYLPGTAATSPFTDDGFLRSGDLFQYVTDEAGDPRYLRYVDRARDLIVRGGMNISPAELEALLVEHPDIVEVAVVGVPDDRYGERTRVVAVVREGARLDLGAVLDFLRRRQIASYKLPESLVVVEELPRNPVGKVLKRELREHLSDAQ